MSVMRGLATINGFWRGWLSPRQAKRDIVERVIADLALQCCRNTRIGSATTRGISGGEVCGGVRLVLCDSMPLFVVFSGQPRDGMPASLLLHDIKCSCRGGSSSLAKLYLQCLPATG